MKLIVVGPKWKMGKLITKIAAERDNLELVTTTVGNELDIEILEMHDQWKKDAPSGTSKEMGEIMAHALGKELKDIAIYGREGAAPREPGTIGYHSLRAGNIPSSHTVYFGGMGERLEITHHSYNWDLTL